MTFAILAIVIVLAIAAAILVFNKSEPPQPKRPTILVCGATGVGKSTLINTLLGEQLSKTGSGEPVTQNTLRVATVASEFVFYDSKGLEVEDASQTYLLLMSDLLRLRFSPNPDEQLDLVLMCIQEPQGRIDDAHFEIAGLCQDLRIPLGIALTKMEDNPQLGRIVLQTFPSAVFVRRVRSLEIRLQHLTIPAEGVPAIRQDIRNAVVRNPTQDNLRARTGRDIQILANLARGLATAGVENGSAWTNFGNQAWGRLGMQGQKWETLIRDQREHVKRQIVPSFMKRKLNTKFDDNQIDAALSRRILPVMIRRFGDDSRALQASDLARITAETISSFADNRPYRSRF